MRRRPIFTRKAVYLLETYNQYIFDVVPKLSKPQIRKVLEGIFSVSIKSLNTAHRPPKKRGRTTSTLPMVKRIFVSIPSREKIIYIRLLRK